MSDFNNLEQRKGDHLDLTQKSQMSMELLEDKFNYEPLLKPHPTSKFPKMVEFLGKKFKAPIWISSMTGGTSAAGEINKNLARAVAEFGLGMGLGSCRSLLYGEKDFADFNLRPLLGDDRPFYANLGIAQVEQFLRDKKVAQITAMIESLQADGLIIHINPLQEWLQPEGDQIKQAPLETIKEFLKIFPFKVVVKEVGQGFGPQGLAELIKLPLAAIDFAAFGGTNFSKMEVLRGGKGPLEMAHIGHTNEEMIKMARIILPVLGKKALCRNFIISGGVQNFLHGFYLKESFAESCVIGQAKAFLEHARGDYEALREYVSSQVEGYALAENYLTLKGEDHCR
ncbi:MAG: isopentenyl-diphosphate delta-isomerase [Epsilonproteobacteria bacterium]|nr:MAG: isopentenyl-diphosphate delta-isomerase [Campylobacterota bacterium]RLA65898.1 MAG: isopentenyl-diphosphate delta-isomerase [Campylobacterota bacterium]